MKKGTRKSAHPIDPEGVRAREIMRRDVLTLRPEDSVEAAVALLEEYHVSGAAVVDDLGHVLGVFTSSDVAREDHVRQAAAGPELGLPPLIDEEVEGESLEEELLGREDYSPEVVGGVRVQDWMTHGAISVGPETALADLCRTMLAESIHRVFVIEDKKLVGVVSTFDVVRLLAREPE